MNSNNFHFKDPVPQIFDSRVVYKFQCGVCNESYDGECVRHLPARSSEYFGIWPLTNKRVQPRKDSAICHRLANCNYSPTFEVFSVLCYENKKYLLEYQESLLRDRPSIKVYILPLSICLNQFFSHFFSELCRVQWSVYYYLFSETFEI